MLKSLRRRMLALTVSIISTVIIGAFVAVYLASELAVDQMNEARLFALHNSTLSMYATAQGGRTADASSGNGSVIPKSSSEAPSASLPKKEAVANETDAQEASAYPSAGFFRMKVSATGNVEVLENSSDLDDETCSALTADIGPDTARGDIRWGDRWWRYLVSEESGTPVIAAGGTRNVSDRPDVGRLITFYDTPSTLTQLNNLATTLVIVAAFTLLAAYFASRLIASRAIRPVQAAWERERQFVADASHELKTPLSIVCANYDVLAANPDESVASQRRWMDGIRYGTDRMESLIDGLLTLSRTDEGKGEPTTPDERFDLGAVAAEAVGAHAARAAEQGIALNAAIAPDVIAHGDRAAAEQIVDALLDNALKYTDRHGTVEVAVKAADGRAVLRIANTGTTIAADDLPHVFDRFWHADRSRTDEGPSGYGLGLSIARACAENLGGTLTAESADGTTAFELSLPSPR